MTIGIISNLYPPYVRGGGEVVASRVARELVARGHRVFVITSRPYDGFAAARKSVIERVAETVYRVCPRNVYYLLDDAKRSFLLRCAWHLIDMWNTSIAKSCADIFDREQPDVVITHNLKGLGLQVVPEIRRRGIPHIHTLHDVQLSVPSGLMIYGQENNVLNRSFLRSLYERAMQSIFQSPSLVISPSKFLLDFYNNRHFFPQSKQEILPNPAPDTSYVSKRKGRRNPHKLSLLFAGQLEAHKGLLFLYETLRASGKDFVLHIAGDGALAPQVNAWCEEDDRVIYHGFVSLRNLFELFDLCDVAIVPSICYENSPTIIYESFQSGTPVIASRIGGIGELIEDGKNGYLFTPGDTKEFLRALDRLENDTDGLLANPESIVAMANKYALRTYVDRLETLMTSLTNKQPLR